VLTKIPECHSWAYVAEHLKMTYQIAISSSRDELLQQVPSGAEVEKKKQGNTTMSNIK